MLPDFATFPNPNSNALLIEGVNARPAKIHQLLPGRARGANREAVIFLLDAEQRASSTRRVRLGDLEDASPLTDKEAAELAKLEAKLAGQDVSERSPEYKRMMRLHHRARHAAEVAAAEAEAKRRADWSEPRRRRA